MLHIKSAPAILFSRCFYQSKTWDTKENNPQGESLDPKQVSVAYDPERYTDYSNFRTSAEYSQFVQQVESDITKMVTFANQHLTSKERTSVEASLNLFKGRILQQDRWDYFEHHIIYVAHRGKKALDQFCNLLGNEELSVIRRATALTALAQGLNVCAPGCTDNLVYHTNNLAADLSGLKGAVDNARKELIQSVIISFMQQNLPDAQTEYFLNSEIHYLAAFWNFMRADLGLPVRDDPLASGLGLRCHHLTECKKVVQQQLTPIRIAQHLSEQCRDSFLEGLSLLEITPQACEKGFDLTEDLSSQLFTGLQQSFGALPRHGLLVNDEKTWLSKVVPDLTLLTLHFLKQFQAHHWVNMSSPKLLIAWKPNTKDEVKLLHYEHQLFWVENREGVVKGEPQQTFLTRSYLGKAFQELSWYNPISADVKAQMVSQVIRSETPDQLPSFPLKLLTWGNCFHIFLQRLNPEQQRNYWVHQCQKFKYSQFCYLHLHFIETRNTELLNCLYQQLSQAQAGQQKNISHTQVIKLQIDKQARTALQHAMSAGCHTITECYLAQLRMLLENKDISGSEYCSILADITLTPFSMMSRLLQRGHHQVLACLLAHLQCTLKNRHLSMQQRQQLFQTRDADNRPLACSAYKDGQYDALSTLLRGSQSMLQENIITTEQYYQLLREESQSGRHERTLLMVNGYSKTYLVILEALSALRQAGEITLPEYFRQLALDSDAVLSGLYIVFKSDKLEVLQALLDGILASPGEFNTLEQPLFYRCFLGHSESDTPILFSLLEEGHAENIKLYLSYLAKALTEMLIAQEDFFDLLLGNYGRHNPALHEALLVKGETLEQLTKYQESTKVYLDFLLEASKNYWLTSSQLLKLLCSPKHFTSVLCALLIEDHPYSLNLYLNTLLEAANNKYLTSKEVVTLCSEQNIFGTSVLEAGVRAKDLKGVKAYLAFLWKASENNILDQRQFEQLLFGASRSESTLSSLLRTGSSASIHWYLNHLGDALKEKKITSGHFFNLLQCHGVGFKPVVLRDMLLTESQGLKQHIAKMQVYCNFLFKASTEKWLESSQLFTLLCGIQDSTPVLRMLLKENTLYSLVFYLNQLSQAASERHLTSEQVYQLYCGGNRTNISVLRELFLHQNLAGAIAYFDSLWETSETEIFESSEFEKLLFGYSESGSLLSSLFSTDEADIMMFYLKYLGKAVAEEKITSETCLKLFQEKDSQGITMIQKIFPNGNPDTHETRLMDFLKAIHEGKVVYGQVIDSGSRR